MVESGPGLRATEEQWGLHPLAADNIAQWRDVSLAMNAARIATPLLLQLSGWEFREALETVAAFRAHQRPLDLYVFPDEYHLKVQPAHRLAIYRRNIQWFDFWLRGREDADPADADQYPRWRQLRAMRTAPTP
jgi:dipeptidyl aminopeptidase/acylaminoacyl peptidase